MRAGASRMSPFSANWSRRPVRTPPGMSASSGPPYGSYGKMRWKSGFGQRGQGSIFGAVKRPVLFGPLAQYLGSFVATSWSSNWRCVSHNLSVVSCEPISTTRSWRCLAISLPPRSLRSTLTVSP